MQDDCSAHFIDECFVAARHLAYAALQDCLLGKDAGVALVPHVDRDGRERLLQLSDEGFHSRKIVAVPTVCLLRKAYDEAFHLFPRKVVLQVGKQSGRLDCSKPARNNLQRVRHSQAGATNPIIYCENSSHIIIIIVPLKVVKDFKDFKVFRDFKVIKVFRVFKVSKVVKDFKVFRVFKDFNDAKVLRSWEASGIYFL